MIPFLAQFSAYRYSPSLRNEWRILLVADFSHLRRLNVNKSSTAEYEIVEIEGDPVLEGVFAGETNIPYYNALLKRSHRNARKFKANKVSSKEIEDARNHDRELYPEYVITGWRNVFDSNGSEVNFSKSNLKEFLNSLPNYLFQDIRDFFGNPESFVSDPEDAPLSKEDSVSLGNSSAPAFGGSVDTNATVGQ